MYQSHITIIGHLGRDPEMRYLPSGTPVTDFSVAVDTSYVTAEGEKIERVKWFKIACWRKLAETTAQYLKRGRGVAVEGEVEAEAYVNGDGKAVPVLKITARTVKFLPRGGDSGNANNTHDEARATPESSTDDIPF